MLINPEAYYDVAQFLKADDFYIHRHRWIWEAFTRLHENRTPIDMLTVADDLERMDQLAEIGGPAFLTSLVNQVPTSLNAESYGRIVEAHSVRRKMITAANQIASIAYNTETSIEEVMGESEKAVFNVSERRLKHDLQPIRSVLSDYYDRIDDLSKRPEDIHGVPTGFKDLDKLLSGLQPSDLLIIAGRPGQGKTGFLLTVARNAALEHKKHVAIFSMEMSNEQVVQRLIAQETGIDSQRLRNGKLAEEEWPLFTHSIEVLSDTMIFLDDTPAITPLQLRTKCRRLHMEYGIDLILLDYLQLMSGDTRNDNRVQEVSFISRNLKVLAPRAQRPRAGCRPALARGRTEDRQGAPAFRPEGIRLARTGRGYRHVHLLPVGIRKGPRPPKPAQDQDRQAPQRTGRQHRPGLHREAGEVRERHQAARGFQWMSLPGSPPPRPSPPSPTRSCATC